MMPYKMQFLAAICPRACWWVQVVAILAVCLASSVTSSAADEQEITIGTLHAQMKYDIASFQVKPGTKVRLTLKNTDEMQHNLVILTPGENKVMEVAQKAWALGEEAVKKAFIPDVPDVLFHTRVVDPQKSDTITFVAPEKEADYPFVCTLPGHAISMKGVMRVTKISAPPVKVIADKNDAAAGFHLHVMDEPLVVRAFVDGGPPRSVSVGLPGGINYLFDADDCYVRFGWTGMFLDVGPNVGVKPGDRGGGWCRILGPKFELGDSGFPLSLGARDVKHTVKFAGYRMRGKEVPQFFFTIDGLRVTQTIRMAPAGLGLQSEFEFERDPGKVFFYVSPQGLDLSSSAGTWQSGRLEVPAGEAKKFSVTIAREQKGGRKPKTPAVAP
jgi:azurin